MHTLLPLGALQLAALAIGQENVFLLRMDDEKLFSMSRPFFEMTMSDNRTFICSPQTLSGSRIAVGDENGVLIMRRGLPSCVTTVQPSSSTRIAAAPMLTMGSTAMVIPRTSRGP